MSSSLLNGHAAATSPSAVTNSMAPLAVSDSASRSVVSLKYHCQACCRVAQPTLWIPPKFIRSLGSDCPGNQICAQTLPLRFHDNSHVVGSGVMRVIDEEVNGRFKIGNGVLLYLPAEESGSELLFLGIPSSASNVNPRTGERCMAGKSPLESSCFELLQPAMNTAKFGDQHCPAFDVSGDWADRVQ